MPFPSLGKRTTGWLKNPQNFTVYSAFKIFYKYLLIVLKIMAAWRPVSHHGAAGIKEKAAVERLSDKRGGAPGTRGAGSSLI
jgi:hypothetical protein